MIEVRLALSADPFDTAVRGDDSEFLFIPRSCAASFVEEPLNEFSVIRVNDSQDFVVTKFVICGEVKDLIASRRRIKPLSDMVPVP